MYPYSATRAATNNRSTSRTSGTVAILLALLENSGASPLTRAYAGKVLGDLGAIDALPRLGRLARFSPQAEVRATAREAFTRITRERQEEPHGFWRRLEAALRRCLSIPAC